MKAIKYADKVLLYIDETAVGMRDLIEKYIEMEYDVVTIQPCHTCQQSGWVEEEERHVK